MRDQAAELPAIARLPNQDLRIFIATANAQG